MEITWQGAIWLWQGPSPWHFITVPTEPSQNLKAMAGLVTYGWGMIPAQVQIGATVWRTSLYVHNEHYVVPIKASVRKAEHLNLGDTVAIRIVVGS